MTVLSFKSVIKMSVLISLLILLEFISIFAKSIDNNSPSDVATLIRTSDCGFSNKSFENELKLNELCHVGVLNAEEVKVKLVYDATPLLCPQIYEANLLICNLTKSSVNFQNILDRGVPNFMKDLRNKYKNVNDFCNSVNNMTFYFKSTSDLNDINDYFQLILKNFTLCHKLCSRFDDSVADLCNVITWAHAFYGNETRSLPSVPVKVSEEPRSNIEYIRPKSDRMREEHLKILDNQHQMNPSISDSLIKPEAAESNRSNTKSPTNVDNDVKTTKNVSKKVNQFTEEEVRVDNNERNTVDNTIKNSKIQADENQLTSPGKSVNTVAKNEEDLVDIDQQAPPNEGRDNIQDMPPQENNNHEDDDDNNNDDGTNKNVDVRNDALKTVESIADPLVSKSGTAKVQDNDYSAGIPNPQDADDQQDMLSSSYGRQPVDTDINEVNPAVMNAAYRGVDRLAGDEGSHFFTYCVSMGVVCGIMYVLFHNKKKILALAVEGRRGRSHSGSRRRPNTAAYSKLDSNLEEAMVSNVAQASVTHVLY